MNAIIKIAKYPFPANNTSFAMLQTLMPKLIAKSALGKNFDLNFDLLRILKDLTIRFE